jgi:hypothetical protein
LNTAVSAFTFILAGTIPYLPLVVLEQAHGLFHFVALTAERGDTLRQIMAERHRAVIAQLWEVSAQLIDTQDISRQPGWP